MFWSRRKPKARPCEAEFLGGPFDGVQVSRTELAEGVAMPVSRNVLRMFAGDFDGRPTPATSVAYYRLVNANGRWRYEYVGAQSARRVHLDGWML